MLTVGAVHIRRDELVRMSYRDGALFLELRWPVVDLPVLFDLPDFSELRFDHLAPERAGIPVRVVGWGAEGGTDPDWLTVFFRLATPAP